MKVQALEYKAEYAENSNRSNNLCILGIAEGAEDANPMVFVEDLLHTLLTADQFSPFYTVETAHCIPPKREPPGSPSSTFIPRLLNFCDRDEVLYAARV